tara:strand:- start:631 stop:795 length:165 start_codon:yes stop_codon:yes gene_type:complete
MLARGVAVGLEPDPDESVKAFGARVRKAEKAGSAPAAKPSGKGYWRRGVFVPSP